MVELFSIDIFIFKLLIFNVGAFFLGILIYYIISVFNQCYNSYICLDCLVMSLFLEQIPSQLI